MVPPKPLAGQKALVTGAHSGIGEGVARALAVAGADVVGNYVAQQAGIARWRRTSDAAGYIHGQTIFVDGGMMLYAEFARGG